MNRKKYTSRLGLQLAFASFAAVTVAVFLFFLLRVVAYNVLSASLLSPDRVAEKEQQFAVRLQDYVSKHKLSSNDTQALDDWSGKRMFLMLYRGNDVLYVNDKRIYESLYGDVSGTLPDEAKMDGNIQLNFTDGPVKAVLIYYYEEVYYQAVNAICFLLSVAVFLLILFLFISRKMRYIAALKRELQILKEGNLDCSITVSGNDELAFLAMELDAMRCALKERQQMEEEARRANRDLVTAMSHDLRTPLTALLGYVDILTLHRYQEEQKEKYLTAVKDKALQIKSMSDQLFEYFIVYGREKDDLELGEVNGEELIGQIVEESLFDLESEGIRVGRSQGRIDCSLEVDVKLIRRVFDNLFSNLLKYADRSKPVQVYYGQQDGRLKVSFVNAVRTEQAKRESTKLGLRTCEKIMQEHAGSFLAAEENGMFRVELCFQIKER